MSRNLMRLTLGLAAMGFVLVGLESQADARRHRCGGRNHGCHKSCHKSCEKPRCEVQCEQPKDCGCKSDCGGCVQDCGGCEKDRGCKKRCGHRNKCRRHRGGGCNGGGCNGGGGGCNGGGCNGGEVIHEGSENGPAPAPPEEEAPSA